MKMTTTPNDIDRENALLQQQLAEAHLANQELSRHLEEFERNRPVRPKKKSSQRTQTVVTETATVQTEAQARTGPVTRQAARAAGETQTQSTNVSAPQRPMQPPSPIRAPP